MESIVSLKFSLQSVCVAISVNFPTFAGISTGEIETQVTRQKIAHEYLKTCVLLLASCK